MQLLSLRRTAGAAIAPRARAARGRSLDVALALAQIDPTAAATSPPLVRWAREAWDATQPCRTRGLSV
eukprot:4364330-Karenia_brevis.AAC.1